MLEREEIYQRVWGYTMVRGDRSVDVFVRKLRHKLERISPAWRYVHTHFGVGYRFAAERVGGGVDAGAARARRLPPGPLQPTVPRRRWRRRSRRDLRPPRHRSSRPRPCAGGSTSSRIRNPRTLRLEMSKNVRNVVIVLVIAALSSWSPAAAPAPTWRSRRLRSRSSRRSPGSRSRLYREHRVALYSLGDGRRATLYGAAVVVALTLTATRRLWQTGAGKVVWFALLAGSAYAAFTIVWSARKY